MSSTGQTLYRRARKVMPGGTQLLSKRPEMFLPGQWPTYFKSAKGAEVVDLDGKTYLDMSYCGIGATILGFADPDVDAAVKTAIDMGSMSTLNCAEDIELAELLVELHPWADMVRFGRAGGEAMAIAIRIARAATGRDMVAFCGYHGWHDWYLSANLGETTALDGHLLPGLDTKGVPRGLAGLMHPFHFNKLDEIEAIVATHGERLAAIVMEPVRSSEPEPAFIKGIRALADRCGAVLIFDEVTSGLRINSRRRPPRLWRRPRYRGVRQGHRQRVSDGGDRRPRLGDGRGAGDLCQLHRVDRARRSGCGTCHPAQASRAECRQASDAHRHAHPEGLDRGCAAQPACRCTSPASRRSGISPSICLTRRRCAPCSRR